MKTKKHEHASVKKEVDLLMSKGLSAERHEKLRENLRHCDDCRAYYNLQRDVEDVLFEGEAALNPAATSRLADLVVAQNSPQPQKAGLFSLTKLIPAAIAATAALFLVVLSQNAQVSSDTSSANESEFQSRGSDSVLSEAAISLLRVDAKAKKLVAFNPNTTPRVQNGEIIQVTYRNNNFSHAALWGLDTSGQLERYQPKADALHPFALKSHSTLTAFGNAWKIKTEADSLRLIAVFAHDAFKMGEVEENLRNALQNGAGDLSDQLPTGLLLHEVQLEVVH